MNLRMNGTPFYCYLTVLFAHVQAYGGIKWILKLKIELLVDEFMTEIPGVNVELLIILC